jgi:hypothetical protein
MRFVEGQFDIFWVSATSAIPWIMVGLSLGALARWKSYEDAQEIEPLARMSPAGWPP